MRARSFLGTAGFFMASIAQGGVSFEQVQTLLNASCVNCHKGDKANGGLQLDTPEGIARAVVPGKSSDSLILQRVTAADPQRRMPLGQSPLKAEEIALLRS